MLFHYTSAKDLKNAIILILLQKQNSRIVIVQWLARVAGVAEGGWNNVFCTIGNGF